MCWFFWCFAKPVSCGLSPKFSWFKNKNLFTWLKVLEILVHSLNTPGWSQWEVAGLTLQRCKTWATETDVNVGHFRFHVLSISDEAGSVLNAL